jgi:hypothetical protein
MSKLTTIMLGSDDRGLCDRGRVGPAVGRSWGCRLSSRDTSASASGGVLPLPPAVPEPEPPSSSARRRLGHAGNEARNYENNDSQGLGLLKR